MKKSLLMSSCLVLVWAAVVGFAWASDSGAVPADGTRLAALRCAKVPVCRTDKVCTPLCAPVCWDALTFTKSCFSPGQCAKIKGCVMLGPCGVRVIRRKQCARACRRVCRTRLLCATEVRCR